MLDASSIQRSQLCLLSRKATGLRGTDFGGAKMFKIAGNNPVNKSSYEYLLNYFKLWDFFFNISTKVVQSYPERVGVGAGFLFQPSQT